MKIFRQIYKYSAFVAFNTFLLIIIVNLLLGLLLWIRGYFVYIKPIETVDALTTYRQQWSDAQAYTRLSPNVVNEYLDEQDRMGSIGLRYEPSLQFREPEFHGSLLNTDAGGFRRTKGGRAFAKPAIKIFVFGGSTTFGYGVPDEFTIPSYLQIALEERYEGVPISVSNYGQGYYYSSQELILFINLIKQGKVPDWAIFIDGANDIGQLAPKRDEPVFTPVVNELWENRASGGKCAGGINWSWIPLMKLARDLKLRYGSTPQSSKSTCIVTTATQHQIIKADDSNMEVTKSRIEYVVSRYTNNMRFIRVICQEYSIQCRFVWQPYPLYKYDLSLHRGFSNLKLDSSSIPKYINGVFSRMEQLRVRDFLYFGMMLEGVREKVFVDDVHYNEAINEKIARRIANLFNFNSNTLRHVF